MIMAYINKFILLKTINYIKNNQINLVGDAGQPWISYILRMLNEHLKEHHNLFFIVVHILFAPTKHYRLVKISKIIFPIF